MREALGLLTTIGGARPLSRRALVWFPAVGALLGAITGAVWWGAGEVWAPLVAAVVVVAVDFALTGMLHVDGLADAADGLLPHATQERRLEVMRSPGVGAFGVAVVGTTLLARVAALATAPVAPVVLAALWCATRSVAAFVPGRVPYARAEGLATPLLGPASPVAPIATVGIAGALVVAGLVDGPVAAGAVVAAALAAVATVAFARRRVGGFTGDVLGAAIVVGETAGLLVWAATW